MPPLGREGAGGYPKVLLVLVAENLQCLMVSSGDCGIKSEVSLTGAQAQLGILCLEKGDSGCLAL